MDVNSWILGGPGGPAGAGYRSGSETYDKRRKAEADLMELMERLNAEKAKQAIAQQKLPIELQQMQANLRKSGLEADQAQQTLGLDAMYGGQQRAANLAQTQSSTAQNQQVTDQQRGTNFLNSLGQSASMGGSISDEQIDKLAKDHGISEKHASGVLVQKLKQIDPTERLKAIQGAQTGGTSNVETRTREAASATRAKETQAEITRRQLEIANIKGRADVQKAIATAKRLGEKIPTSFQGEIVAIGRKMDEAAAAGNDQLFVFYKEKLANIQERLDRQVPMAARSAFEFDQDPSGSLRPRAVTKQPAADPPRAPRQAPHSLTPMTNTGGPPQAAQASSDPDEGKTIVNDAGVELIKRNGKWVSP